MAARKIKHARRASETLLLTFVVSMLSAAHALSPVALASDEGDRAKSQAFAQSPAQIVILGDSMSAGALANTRIGETIHPGTLAHLLAASALGRALDTTGMPYRKTVQHLVASRRHTAFEADAAWSLRSQLAGLTGRVNVRNFSLVSTTAEELPRQIESSRRLSAAGHSSVDIVVVNAGANDWCEFETSAEAYLDQMRINLDLIAEHHPRALVVVNGLPDVARVFSLPDRSAFRVGRLERLCSTLNESQARQCPAGIALRQHRSPDLFDELRHKQRRMHEGLKELVAASQMRHKADPQGAPDFVFVDLLALDAPESSLAADCYHPGRDYHELWGRLLWKTISRSPFYKSLLTSAHNP